MVYYSPISPCVPHVLAHSSRPSSPAHRSPNSPASSFSRQAAALAARLAEVDQLRRYTGLPHCREWKLGLAAFESTQCKGKWVESPWALPAKRNRTVEEGRMDAEAATWEKMGMKGLPKDMQEWDEWEARKAEYRRTAFQGRKRRRSASPVETSGHGAAEAQIARVRESEEENCRAYPSPAMTTTNGMLSSFFSASKASVAGCAKQPPPPSSSPAAPRRPSKDESFPSLTSLNSAGQSASRPSNHSSRPTPRRGGEYDTASTSRLGQSEAPAPAAAEAGKRWGSGEGEDEEVLFEAGCTQMVLLEPTPNPPAADWTSHSQPAHLYPTASSSTAPLTATHFHPSPIDLDPSLPLKAVTSTPHLAATSKPVSEFGPLVPASSPASTLPHPSTLTRATDAPAPASSQVQQQQLPVMRRLSSIADLKSLASMEGSTQGDAEEISKFLEQEEEED
ncbi:hypothetical protein JCM1841_002560 [Sporobolomyces salmonicolor]